MRQLIIARKDLNMSPGKLAAQVAHASMAFLSGIMEAKQIPNCEISPTGYGTGRVQMYRRNDLARMSGEAYERGERYFYYRPVDPDNPYGELEQCEYGYDKYKVTFELDKDVYEEWFKGIFTKTICEAKNKSQLLKAAAIADDLKLKEGRDYFFIKDNCLTELEPEEIGEDGIGRTLTCIGFRPLLDDVAHEISRKYQLYK